MKCDRCTQDCQQGRRCPYRKRRQALPESALLALVAALVLVIWLGWRWFSA